MTKRDFNTALDKLAKFPGERVIDVERTGTCSVIWSVSIRCVEPTRMRWNCHGKTLIECRKKESADRHAAKYRRWLKEYKEGVQEQ